MHIGLVHAPMGHAKVMDRDGSCVLISSTCMQERAGPETLLVYHTAAFAAKLDDDPKQHVHKVCTRRLHDRRR